MVSHGRFATQSVLIIQSLKVPLCYLSSLSQWSEYGVSNFIILSTSRQGLRQENWKRKMAVPNDDALPVAAFDQDWDECKKLLATRLTVINAKHPLCGNSGTALHFAAQHDNTEVSPFPGASSRHTGRRLACTCTGIRPLSDPIVRNSSKSSHALIQHPSFPS